MKRALYSYETAPCDDEPEPEGEASMAEESLRELARGEFFTHAEIRRLLGLPAATMLERLNTRDDQRLWRASHRTLPQRAARRLRALTCLQQRRSLTIAEDQELTQLLNRLEDIGLVRAKAAALLKERGHDVSVLLPRS
jgi:hypothetical protein